MAKINTVVVPSTPVFDPARSDDERERQMISLSMDAAEARIRAGVATSAEICHFLKLGSVRAKYEQEELQENIKLLKAKSDDILESKKASAQFEELMSVLKQYGGVSDDDEGYEDEQSY